MKRLKWYFYLFYMLFNFLEVFLKLKYLDYWERIDLSYEVIVFLVVYNRVKIYVIDFL